MRTTRLLIAGAGFAAVVGFASCGDDDPPAGRSDQTPPTIVSLTPANGSQNVAATTEVRARFSEEIDPGTVTASSFVLSLDDVVVPGARATAGDEITFTPTDPLVEGVRYVATVTTDVTDLVGNRLAGEVTWLFDTGDPTAPTVVSTAPFDGAEGVAPAAPIVVTFSEPVIAASVTASSFSLIGPGGAVSGARSVNGAVVILTPAVELDAETSYTAGVTSAILDLAGNALASPTSWSFTTGMEGVLGVAEVSPPDGATGVSTLADIVITFTEAVDAASVTGSSFLVDTAVSPAAGGGVAGTIEVAGAVATFTPNDRLRSEVTYDVQVTTDVRDLDGEPLGTAFASSFTTRDDVAPTVESVSPSTGATDVPINSDVVAVFSEAVDAATVDESTFSVEGPLAAPVAGTYIVTGAEVRFDPDVDFDGQVEYTVSIGVGVRDLAGNSLAGSFAWTFSTADASLPFVVSTVPEDGDTGVPVSGSVSATFSEALDPASVTAGSFSLELLDGGAVPAAVSVSGPVAKLDPEADLAQVTDYIVRLTTDIRDAAGNAMAAPFAWTFTTEDATAPIVVATMPANGATDVPPTITLSVEFSEVVDPASVNFTSFIVEETGGSAVLGFVGADETTATFSPTSPLRSETSYTARVTTLVTDLAGNSLAEEVAWSFLIADVIAPSVKSTSPVGGATDVSITPVVTATFSENIDPASVTGSSFTLEAAGGDPVTAITNVVGAVAALTPTTVLSGPTEFTARLTTAISDLAGNGLAAPVTWSFTTVDVSGPVVVTTSPLDGATGVSPAATLSIEFSEPVDPATATGAVFTLSEVGGGAVTGTVSAIGSTVTFVPSADLASSAEYAAGVTTALTDLAGNPLDAEFGWSFTVADVVPPNVTELTPVDGAVDVPVESTVTATFSEDISPASITPTSFSLRESGGGAVGASLGVSGNVATLDPIADLPDGTVLTARLTTAVTDLSGNGLGGDVEWSFTTVDLSGPTVVSTNPSAGAVGVDPAITLAVEFSERVDPATINDTSFSLERSGGGAVTGTVAEDTTSATFDPDVDLESRAVYTARLTTAITDTLGNPMAAEFSWSFTIADVEGPTVIGTVPAAGATGVDTDVVLQALFSESVDPASVTATTFLVEAAGGEGVVGVIDVAIDVVRFTPSEDLTAGVVYTVTVTTGVTDAVGNPLPAEFGWSFTTEEPPDTDPPLVVSTTPAAGTTVPAPTAVTVTMSEAIAPASVTGATFGMRTDGLTVPGAVDVVDSTLTFTPTDSLAGNWRYTIVVTTGVTDLAGNPLATDFAASFQTSPVSGPAVQNAATGNWIRVSETGPVSWTQARDDASGLSHLGRRGRLATLTTAEEVQGLRDAGVNLAGLWIGGSQGPLAAEPADGWQWVDADEPWGYEAWRAGSPDDTSGLEDFLRYDALGEAWIDAVEDGADARGYLVEFDFIPPQVVTRDPADGATAVPVDAAVTIGFSERVDPATVTTFTVEILQGGVVPVPATIDTAGNPAVVVTPLAPLLSSTGYTVRVSTGVTDEAGNGLELDETWTFTTGP